MNTNQNIHATIPDAPGLLMWQKDLNSVYSSLGSEYANLMGFSKPEQMINLTDYDIPCKLSELAGVFRKQDQYAIKTKSKIRLLEILSCKDNVMSYEFVGYPLISTKLEKHPLFQRGAIFNSLDTIHS